MSDEFPTPEESIELQRDQFDAANTRTEALEPVHGVLSMCIVHEHSDVGDDGDACDGIPEQLAELTPFSVDEIETELEALTERFMDYVEEHGETDGEGGVSVTFPAVDDLE